MNKTPKSLWTNPIHFIACGFGIGAIPFAPGTFGTLLGVLIYLAMRHLPLVGYLAVVFAMNVVGIYLCGKVNRDWGTKDHPAAVWDEIAAFPITLIAMPWAWYWVLTAFILFRILDIAKPWPIYLLERVKGGLGIMLDDIGAAVIVLIVLQLARHFLAG